MASDRREPYLFRRDISVQKQRKGTENGLYHKSSDVFRVQSGDTELRRSRLKRGRRGHHSGISFQGSARQKENRIIKTPPYGGVILL